MGSRRYLLPDNTQLSQETDIRKPGGTGTPTPRNERLQIQALDLAATSIGYLIISLCLTQQDNMPAKYFEMKDVTTLSKTRQFHSPKINHNL
jgi:hypothetical protein